MEDINLDAHLGHELVEDFIFIDKNIAKEAKKYGIKIATKQFFLYQLHRWFEKNGRYDYCFTGVPEMARRLGEKPNSIRDAYQELIKKGAIISVLCDNRIYRNKNHIYVSTEHNQGRFKHTKTDRLKMEKKFEMIEKGDNIAKIDPLGKSNDPLGKSNHNNNINKDINKNINREGRFTPPSLSEIEDYCKERNNQINAETFIDFYQAKNWMIGRNKMKDWRACVRTWEKRNKKTKGGFEKITI